MVLYQLRGTPYEMGFQMGEAHGDAVALMCTDYPIHTLLEFANRESAAAVAFLQQHSATIYNHAWEKYGHLAQGPWLEEMQGLVDGAKRPNEVNVPNLFALNFGPDLLFALVYRQAFLPMLDALGLDPAVIAQHLRVPDRCNTRLDGLTGMFMRDFQFPNGGVFHKVSGLIVREPTKASGLHRTACVAGPGMLGSATMMNCHGLSVTTNLLRSPCADIAQVHLPVSMMMRACGERYETVEQVIWAFEQVTHGTPWLYSALDRYGDAAVIAVSAQGYTGVPPVLVRRRGWGQPDGVVIQTVDEEEALKKSVGVFRAWLPETDKLVVTNMTLFPELQKARAGSEWIRFLERGCTAPVYRYLHMIQGEVYNVEQAKAKAAFLSPLEPLKYKPNLGTTYIEGALTVTYDGTIYWKVGRWDSAWESFTFA